MGVHKAHWIQGLRGLATLGFGLTLMLAGGSNARAQVIEVHSDGSTTVFSGPAVITPQGVSAIAPKTENTLRATNPPAGIGIAIQGAANRHDVSARLVEAVARRESGLRQDAVSPKGARGVMQLMPVTARTLGVNAADMTENVEGGTAYLAQMLRRFGGDLVRALAAYNAGPDAVTRYGGVPPYAETKAYVAAVLDDLASAVQTN